MTVGRKLDGLFYLYNSHVGQLIVHLAVNQDVAGLSPAVRAKCCPMV